MISFHVHMLYASAAIGRVCTYATDKCAAALQRRKQVLTAGCARQYRISHTRIYAGAALGRACIHTFPHLGRQLRLHPVSISFPSASRIPTAAVSTFLDFIHYFTMHLTILRSDSGYMLAVSFCTNTRPTSRFALCYWQ